MIASDAATYFLTWAWHARQAWQEQELARFLEVGRRAGATEDDLQLIADAARAVFDCERILTERLAAMIHVEAGAALH